MQLRDRVRKAVYAAIDELNLQMPDGRRVEKSPADRLLGDRGKLDSLGVVNFVVAVEQSLEGEFQAGVSLSDLMTGDDTDGLATVGSLCNYVEALLAKGGNGD